MSMEMRVEGQRLLVVRIHGILRQAEFDECQRAAAEVIRAVGKVAALIVLDGFQGWEHRDEWGDMSFLIEHDNDIEKIAIVGPSEHQDDVMIFVAAPLRAGRVRYFSSESEARVWLGAHQ